MNKIIKDGKYNDLSLDEFAYLVETFLLDNHILDTYYIPDSVSFNLNLLRDASDIVYINRWNGCIIILNIYFSGPPEIKYL